MAGCAQTHELFGDLSDELPATHLWHFFAGPCAKCRYIDQMQHLFSGVSASKQKTQVARSYVQDA